MSKVIIVTLLLIILVMIATYPTYRDCNLSEDTILLQEAIDDGWSVIIVKDILATSPNVTLITN